MEIYKQQELIYQNVISKKLIGTQKEVLNQIKSFQDEMNFLGICVYPQITVNYSSKSLAHGNYLESETFILSNSMNVKKVKDKYTVHNELKWENVVVLDFTGLMSDVREANDALNIYIKNNNLNVENIAYVQVNEEMAGVNPSQQVHLKIFVKEIVGC